MIRRDQTAKRQRLRQDAPPCERRLWSQLRREACGVKFRRQVSVGTFVLDFYCPALRLAIEVDGASHHSAEAVVYDTARQQQIEALGVRFLRFSNEQVQKQLTEVMETILATIAAMQQVDDPLCPSDISPSTKGRVSGGVVDTEHSSGQCAVASVSRPRLLTTPASSPLSVSSLPVLPIVEGEMSEGQRGLKP